MYNPFIRQNNIKADNIMSFSIDGFDGGINNVLMPTQIADNEAQDILNYSLKSDAKRNGTELYDELDLIEEVVYMDIYSPIDEEKVIIRATEEEVYAGEDIIASVNGKIQGASYIDNYYFVDGDKFYQYDGEKVYRIITAPHSRLAEDIIPGSYLRLTEWHDGIKAGMEGQIEGVDSISKFRVNAADKEQLLVQISAHDGEPKKKGSFVRFYVPLDENHYAGNYVVDEDRSMKWYEPCEHELDDILKGEPYLPDNCSCITADKDRFYISGCKDHPHEIYISDINNPFYFPVNLGLQCPPNGDEVVDLINYDDGIIVGRRNDVYIVRGNTADLSLSGTFTLQQINTHTGFASKDNAKIVNNYLFYIGSDMNVYGLNPVWGTTTLASSVINKEKIDFSKAPFNLTKEDIKNSPSIYFDDEYYFIVNGIVVVYNYIKRAWTKYSGWGASFFLVKDNELLIGTRGGKTLKTSKGYNDVENVIDCYYKTKQYNLGMPINYKNFLDMFAVTHTYRKDNSTIKIFPIIDYDGFRTSVDILNILSKFGVTRFGETLISSGIAQTDNIPINVRGRLISFIFSNSEDDEPMKVYQLSCTYILRGVR